MCTTGINFRGLGMPVLAADYIPKGVDVLLQCENGILGLVSELVEIV